MTNPKDKAHMWIEKRKLKKEERERSSKYHKLNMWLKFPLPSDVALQTFLNGSTTINHTLTLPHNVSLSLSL